MSIFIVLALITIGLFGVACLLGYIHAYWKETHRR